MNVRTTVLSAVLLFSLLLAGGSVAEAQLTEKQVQDRAASSIAVVLVGDDEGVVTKLASAMVVQEDGILITPYHVVRDAKQLQVRLKSGEIFDDVSLLSYDARRDVAAIKIQASGLTVPAFADPDTASNDKAIVLFTHKPGELWGVTKGTFIGGKMADQVPGAGEGFRVVELSAEMSAGTDGAIAFRSDGSAIALVTIEVSTPSNSIFGVPITSVKGLASATRSRSFGNGASLKLPSAGALNAARHPSIDPKDLLLISKTVYIETNTTFFKEQQLITELNKRKEVKDWGWTIVSGSWDVRNKADMIIELDHQILTFDFTYAIRHRKTSVVIAAGKVIIADGASGTPKMVDRIIKDLYKVRGETPPKK